MGYNVKRYFLFTDKLLGDELAGEVLSNPLNLSRITTQLDKERRHLYSWMDQILPQMCTASA